MQRMLPLLALALAGCATVPAPAAGPTAAIGQAALVDGVIVRPLSVVEDSRCPSNVQCVWAGRLVILAEVEYRGGSETFRGRMTLGQPLPLGKQVVTLVSAIPERLAGKPTDPRAYRFTFSADTQR